jgi:D-alanine-D-alanine ligase
VMLEEYIDGIEATVGVIDSFREMDYYALPPVEIRPVGKTFFDHDSKYDTNTIEIVPGNFTFEQKKVLEEMAKEAHKALGLRHYSRSDFRIHPKRGIFILETNTLPAMTEASLFPKALNAVGSSLSHFFHHLIDLALHKK